MIGSCPKLLVIGKDPSVRETVRLTLPSHWAMTCVGHLKELEPLDEFNTVTAALVDIHHVGPPEGTMHAHGCRVYGVEVLSQLRRTLPQMELVATSADLDPILMEKCLAAGAWRFIGKPLAPQEVRVVLEKIEAFNWLKLEKSCSRNLYWIGKSEISQNIRKQIANMKGERGPILLEGESGTGKEIVAQLLHQQEGPDRPIIQVNVATLGESLFESELFGHSKGAFTGADSHRMGLAEAANGGDIFLDEIETLPLAIQAKLLRFLEDGEVRRVGSLRSTHVEVRVIAATNQNLERLVEAGQFRPDLYWRLIGKKIYLPPLRHHPDDIFDLATEFMKRQSPRYNKILSDAAPQLLKIYHWRGNVRQLLRLCELLCMSAPLPLVRGQDVTAILKPALAKKELNLLDLSKGLPQLLFEIEGQILRDAVSKESDVEALAQLLRISRSSIYKKLKEHQLEL